MSEGHDRPRASVIVVAWRLADELRECLDSLLASADAPRFDVIVVANGAERHIIDIANNHSVVDRVIICEANIGFGAACNLAAATSTAEFLIFLNDDTRVDALWLKSIVQAGMNHPAVASLLLNYDSTVQEAGSRILSHGGTAQFARGMATDEAEEQGFLRPRVVDYGSAAALLIERDLFLTLGGFDPIFEPAYFEDVDLQLRLRQVGGHVWFEPSAKVLHHSGRSTRADHWFRQFAGNRSGRRFVERWSEVLASAPGANDPLDVVIEVPPTDLPPSNELQASHDDYVLRALKISYDYEEWLTEQLTQLSEYHAELIVDPDAPTRQQLLDRVHELTMRLNDVERRGPIGVLKMQIGRLARAVQSRRR